MRQRRRTQACCLLVLCGLLGGAARSGAAQASERASIVRPQARVQTTPVPSKHDAADDPAIWIHPRDPAASLVLGTDKRDGLHTYNLDGSEHQALASGTEPNNVDVLYDFRLGRRTVDLAVAGVQAPRNGRGLKVWVIDATTRRLDDITDGDALPVFGGGTPYGVCAYHSARTGRFYAFVTGRDGAVEQYELTASAGGRVGGRRVRAFAVGSTAEACVADDDLGYLYLAEESVGIWKFGAEPDAGGNARGRLIARVGEHGLTADVEGLALYSGADGHGYLIASSQGNDTYKVYARGAGNQFVLTIDPSDGHIDDVEHTDGIAVTNCPTSRRFSRGVFIVQDGHNSGGNQNFKLYGWEDIAGGGLPVDTVCRVRRPPSSS